MNTRDQIIFGLMLLAFVPFFGVACTNVQSKEQKPKAQFTVEWYHPIPHSTAQTSERFEVDGFYVSGSYISIDLPNGKQKQLSGTWSITEN